MEINFKDLQEMSSAERKRTLRAMDGALSKQHPSLADRLWSAFRHLRLLLGAAR